MLWKVLGWAVAFMVVYAVASCIWPHQRFASDFVLLLTVCVVVWYTLETSKIRRQGEKRAEIDAKPVLGLYLERQDATKPLLYNPEKGTVEVGPKTISNEIWFRVRNYTRNPAILRVVLRLRTSAGSGQFDSGAYSGHRDWQLAAFQPFNGHFPLLHLVASVQGEQMKLVNFLPGAPPQRITWPAEAAMDLDVQVGVYDAKRRLKDVLHQEYRVVWATQDGDFEFWPEIAPTKFERLNWPKDLPHGKLEF